MLPGTTSKQVLIVNKLLNLNCNQVLPKNSQLIKNNFPIVQTLNVALENCYTLIFFVYVCELRAV